MKEIHTVTKTRLLTLLLLNRISFLQPREKFNLALRCASDTEQASTKIMSMTLKEWMTLLGRRVRTTSWTEETKQKIRRGICIDLLWLGSGKGSICTIDNSMYPELLKHIPDPPIVLFVLGKNLEILKKKNISIVGTRHPNKEGMKYAFAMGSYFAKEGINIVSGFAYGIDITAHKGVLQTCAEHQDKNSTNTSCIIGKPIVVLGTSIDQIYPKRHIDLARRVLSYGGLILSEHSPSSDTYKANFIGRNRVISGLSMDSIVVQAPKKSGALATAEFALEQGRNLWVHKAGLSTDFEGTLNLYGEGASTIFDVGEELLI